jgi:hypothetical protein
VVVLSLDGKWVALAAADVMFRSDTVPAVSAALEERIGRAEKWWDKRQGCRAVLEGWSAPHTLQLFIDQSEDAGDPNCGVETGPVDVGGSSELASSTSSFQLQGCGWRHQSGATLTRSCPGDIGDRLAEPLALSADALLFEDDWNEYWYAPPSRQRPFPRVHFEARDEQPAAWHVVTFGGEKPGVQRLAKPQDVGDLTLSLASGWHLYSSSGDDHAMRWVRFVQRAGRQLVVTQ